MHYQRFSALKVNVTDVYLHLCARGTLTPRRILRGLSTRVECPPPALSPCARAEGLLSKIKTAAWSAIHRFYARAPELRDYCRR